ncbi:MAG: ATP-binding protein [Acidobacteriota bacterium]
MLKRELSDWSLQTRILVVTVFLCASVLGITTWVNTVTSVRAVENTIGMQTDHAARRLAALLQGTSTQEIPIAYDHHVKEILELEPNIFRVDLYADVEGELQLIRSSSSLGDRPLEGGEIEAWFGMREQTFTAQGKGGKQVFSVVPVIFAGGQRGFLSVVSSLQAADIIRSVHARVGMYSLGAAVAFLVGAITWLFRTTVYRSIRHLVEVMRRFRIGEQNVRASASLPAELGELAHSMNLMLSDQEKFNERLQTRIEEATHELADRNKALHELNLQLVETQRQLTQAERLALVGQLTATLAHEVGSPLSAVSTHLQMLLESEGLDSKAHHRLEVANEQIDRVCSIVEHLLAATRQNLQKSTVDLEAILRAVAGLLGPTMESRQVRMELITNGGPFWVQGHSGQLQQLFLNLLNNALDAISPPGRIDVKMRRVGLPDECTPSQGVEVVIEDTGCGISADQTDRIFEPFFTTKEFGRGTGLGLAVCKEIVKQHGGSISVSSVLGKGSCFTIQLPERLDPVSSRTFSHESQEVESR